MQTIILAGAGQIGYRHLLALWSLPGSADIHLLDVDTQRLQACASQIESGSARRHRLSLHDRVGSLPTESDLVVIATSSGPRRKVFEQLAAHTRFQICVLEKVLFQRRRDLAEVGEELRRRGMCAWVNCTRRVGGYQRLREELAGQRALQMTVAGGEWGLACNAIHYIDAFAFLTGEAVTRVDAAGLELPPIASKRTGYIEFTGSVIAETAGGSVLRISCEAGSRASPVVTLEDSGALHLQVVEAEGRLLRRRDSTVAEESFEMLPTSRLTSQYERLLGDRTCGLTGYTESARLHDVLLLALQHRLGLTDDAVCPIT